MSTYNMFKTHCAASAVEHSASGNFTSPTDINLIIAKNNIIEIYKLPQETPKNEDIKLLLIARYRLFGEVQCIECARFVPNDCDSLLISFPDAKLSVIDFLCNTIETKALFNFDPLHRRIGNITSCHNLQIRVDPLQRCAALLISQDLIFVLPLFVGYLIHHKQRKGSNPIDIVFKDTLSNEHQQEIEDEEERLNPSRKDNHNNSSIHNDIHNEYVSPLPPPVSMVSIQEEEEEDIEYIECVSGVKRKDMYLDIEWDAAYQKGTYYQYKSLCSKGYFMINLRAKCEKIVDFIFLDGYNTPQILMLFEKTPTWGGRIPVRNKTISLCSITLNVLHKMYNIPFILFNILSHDFNKLHAIASSSNILHSSIILEQSTKHKNKYVPHNVGGALLIGCNGILHFGQNIDFGLSFNQNGDILSKDFVLLRRWTERVINLENCVLTTLYNKQHSEFILSDGNGFIYLLSIQSGKMALSTFGVGPIASCMTSIKKHSLRFVFIGSRLGDSLFIKHNIRKQKDLQLPLPVSPHHDHDIQMVNYTNDTMDLAMDLFGVTTETLAVQAKHSVITHSESMPPRHHSLYGPKVKRRKLTAKSELQIHDLHLMNVVDFSDDKLFELEIEKEDQSRPISADCDDEEQKDQEQENEAQIEEYRKSEEMLREKYEFKIHDTITNMAPITSVVMAKSHDARFLHSDYINMMASTGFGTQSKLSIVQEGIRPQILAKTNSNRILNGIGCWTLYKPGYTQYHSYLVITDAHKTQVIEVIDRVKVMEDTDTDFINNARTIVCGHIAGKQMFTAQVYTNGVRLLNGLKLVYQYKDSDLHIIDAYICDPFILLHLKDKTIQLLSYEMESKAFKVTKPHLLRYKEISDAEKQRRKREFVSRRCNRMRWDQYIELERCINDFKKEDKKGIAALIEYINHRLMDNELNEEKKTNSIESNDKTLFNLNLSIKIILKRLFGKHLGDSVDIAPNHILEEMITRDLDIGDIQKVYLYQHKHIKSKTLNELHNEYERRKRKLLSSNASTFAQLLSSSFQTKTLNFKAQSEKHKNMKENHNDIDREESLMREMYFGGEIKDETDDENDEHNDDDVEIETFAVIARTSGILQMFKVPSFTLVFECSEINIGHKLFVNNLIHDESLQIILSKHQLTKRKNLKDFIEEETANKCQLNETYFNDELIPQTLSDELWCSYNDNQEEESAVHQLYVHTFDNDPYLLIALSNGDLLIYQMFFYFEGRNALLSKIGRNLNNPNVSQMCVLPMRLSRFHHKLFTRDISIYGISNINGLCGVLIGGAHPAIILSHRGSPMIHDFSLNDDITGFCVFNHPKISNVAQDENVKNGCFYLNEYGLTIATIPKSMHNIACNHNVFKDIDGINEQKTQKDDENEEIFGHSFVLMKQRINASKEYVHIDYTFEYPVAHIPLSETLHFMVEHPQSGTYLLIMSRYKYIAGTEMLKSRDIRPTETYFECRLLNPYKWRFDDRLTGFIIHQNTDHETDGSGSNLNSIPISEHILCGKSVNIQESSRIGSQTVVKKNLIILGTGTNQGEDSASIGRIVMLEIIPEKESKKLDEIKAPNTNRNERDERFYTRTKHNSDRLLSQTICEASLEDETMTQIYSNSSYLQKKYYRKEFAYYKKCMQQDKTSNIRYRIHYVFARRERAAVTALNCVNGLIVAAIGPKLLLFRWDGTQLIGCAFLDTRIHCHNILVLNNFVLTADLFQGLDLYHWEQDIASIVKLGRDVQYRSIYSVNWLIHKSNNNEFESQNEFEFLVSDLHQNLQIISYSPHLLQYGFLSTIDKEKLYTRCLFHIGTNISDSIIIKFRDNANYFNLNGCIDGSISYLIPISEQVYRRLSSLHSQMIFYCQHLCGLNPREYRYSMNNCISGKDTSRKSHIMHNHSLLNSIHGKDRSATLTSKNIVDHDLIEKFLTLDYRTQNKLTTHIGVKNANVIITHLSEISNNTKWF